MHLYWREVQEEITFMKQEEYASFVNSPHLCNTMQTSALIWDQSRPLTVSRPVASFWAQA